eukprot:scaffold4686_cov140-Amphora_coffeaeformis.AAC.3
MGLLEFPKTSIRPKNLDQHQKHTKHGSSCQYHDGVNVLSFSQTKSTASIRVGALARIATFFVIATIGT